MTAQATESKSRRSIGSAARWTIAIPIRSLAVLLWVASGRPSVIWHYFKDNLRYRLVDYGILATSAEKVARARAEFDKHASQGQFSALWFDRNIVPWCLIFSKTFDRADPVRILEIGSWEGRSTLFLLTYFPQGHVTAVDPWSGNEEHQEDVAWDLQGLEIRFDKNVSPLAARLIKRKGLSSHILPELLDQEQKFDIIYVDGSHVAEDVLTDAINSWRLLNDGGLLIFDDFLWTSYERARANPAWPISLFLKYHEGEYNLLTVSRTGFFNAQVILQKRLTFIDHVVVYPQSIKVLPSFRKTPK